MHIVIEGPDGSGKTTLLQKLQLATQLPMYPRASTSKEGPVRNVAEWVNDCSVNVANHNAPTFQGNYLFDRHAIISEPIYAPTLKRQSHPMFYYPWWVERHRRILAMHTLVVFCLPPKYLVQANVTRTAEDQLKGVVEHISTLYDLYQSAWQFWPGPTMRYDYDLGDDHTDNTIETITKWAKR